MRILLLLALSLLGSQVLADWQLDPARSRVSFVSTKRGDVADVQRFRDISGTVDAAGQVRLILPFSGLDTGLALRDERTRQELFEIERFPQAEAVSQVDLAAWEALDVGASRVEILEFSLDLHGKQLRLKAEMLVSRLGEQSMQAVTLEPVILKAGDFELLAGLDKLKKIASVPSISPEVPVFAVLNFQQRP